MSVHETKYNLHKEALEETLEAIKLLIGYEKETFPDKWDNNAGCLGYPSATLLFSYINAFGNLFYDENINGVKISSDTRTFQILNSKYFENQNIQPDTLDRLYDIYRSKLIHNLSLPENYFIKIKAPAGIWYEIVLDSKGKEIISTVYIQDLFALCLRAYENLKTNHRPQYNSSIKTINLTYKDLATNPTIKSINSSGVIRTDQ